MRTGLVWPNSADERAAIGNPYGTVYSIIEPFCSRYSDFLSRGQTRPYHPPPAAPSGRKLSSRKLPNNRVAGRALPPPHYIAKAVRYAVPSTGKPRFRHPRPRLRRPASGRAGTVNLSGSCRICPRDRKPNPGHRAGRWAKPVRPNAYFPRQPELPRSDAQPLPRDFSSHASRVLEYASTADAADR